VTFSDLFDPVVDQDIHNQVDYLSCRDQCYLCFRKAISSDVMLESNRVPKYLLFQRTLLFHYIGIELSWVLKCFSIYTNFEFTYANMSRLSCLAFSLAVFKTKSLGCSVWIIIYPHKLNSQVVFVSCSLRCYREEG